jgi:hypothetical protein
VAFKFTDSKIGKAGKFYQGPADVEFDVTRAEIGEVGTVVDVRTPTSKKRGAEGRLENWRNRMALISVLIAALAVGIALWKLLF